MLELKNVSISLQKDGRHILDDFSFTLEKGEKAVIIGEEGNGKSTLLKFIYDRRLTEGYCQCSGGVTARGKTGYLPQLLEERYHGLTAAEFFAASELHSHVGVMAQLGLSMDFFTSSQRMGTLSGGEKVKAQLARVLMEDPDILLLDEPTNDLDIETLEWLEGFIRGTRMPVLYVSHDETLIENTANVILHMEQIIRKTRCRMTVTRAGYRKYLAFRRGSLDKQRQVAQKQRDDYDRQMERWREIYDRVEHEQRSIAKSQRDHAGQMMKKKMKSVLSQGRRFQREAEDFTEFPEEEDAIITRFSPDIRIPAGKVVLDMSLPELRAGGRLLARDIKLNVTGPAHVGITGRNGAGKSTLLAALWSELRDRRDVTACYMPQDYAESLDYAKTPVEYLAANYGREDVTRARTFMGSMRFTHEEMTGKIGTLSGGQRAKILLLDMVLRGANVLVLDEPTRNFSPLSGPVVRGAIRAFGGAVISVSHDRKYLEQVCDTVYELESAGLVKIK